MDGAISVGRNVGDAPMNAKDWRAFVKGVVSTVRSAGGIVYASARGRGKWEGIPEQNAVVTFANVSDVALLDEQLGKLAKQYHQDAIAIVTGESRLISV